MSDVASEVEPRTKAIGPWGVWGTTVAGPISLLLGFNTELRGIGLPAVLAGVVLGFFQHALVVELTVAVRGGGSSFSFARAFLTPSWGRAAGLADLWTMLLAMASAAILVVIAASESSAATVAVCVGVFAVQLVRPRVLTRLWASFGVVAVLGIVALVAAGAFSATPSGGLTAVKAQEFELVDGLWLPLLFAVTPLMPLPADETSISQERLARVGLVSSLTIAFVAVLLALVGDDTVGSAVLEKFSFDDDSWIAALLALSVWSQTWRSATTTVRGLSRSGQISEYWSVMHTFGPLRASLWALVLATGAAISTAVIVLVVSERISVLLGLLVTPVLFRTALMPTSYLSFRLRSRRDRGIRYTAPFGMFIASGILLASLGTVVLFLYFRRDGVLLDLLILSMVLIPPFLWCKAAKRHEIQNEPLLLN
jgi:hypothetical protein